MIRRIIASASGVVLAVLAASGASAAAGGFHRPAATTASASALPARGAAAQASGLTYLSQFGGPGSGPGQFESPAAVAVNTATGDVYVTDIVNDVVEVFSASGSYLSEFGGPGTFPPGNGQFDQPIAIAVDPGSGDVYVLDYNGNARIQEFDASGTFRRSWSLPQFQANQVAVDPASGDVYVTDTANDQVIEFSSLGTEVSSFGNPGTPGTGPGQFTAPTTIAVDPSTRDLYVTDTTFGCRTQKFDSSGTFLLQFGGCGSGDGQFNPGGVGGNSGEIYGPTGLAVDPVFGDVYAVDGGNNRVEVSDSAGNFLSAFGWGVADGASQFETCTSSCQAGSSGTGNGQFSNPAGDALDPATGQLYVVDNGNDRVQVFGTSQASTTTVSSSANPSVPGQSVTYTAAVSPVPEQGTVAFADNGQPVTACGSQPVDGSTGNATCTVSYPGTGSHSVTATYSNSIGVAGSVSVVLTQNVQQGATTTALTSSLNPSAPGQAVTYTATVAPVAPAAGTPAGAVSFSDGSTPVAGCTAQALTGTTATCTVTYASPGSHPVTATYGGDANFAASAPSNVVHQVVGPVPPAPVVASIAPAFGPGAGGTRVTITGDNLCQATGVDFGSAAAAAFSGARPGHPGNVCVLVATSPPSTGVVDVTVTSAGGTSATGPQDRYSYAPVVASITPAFGPAAGGTHVLITGDNLCKATGADFGSVPAAAFHVGSGFPKGVCNVVATSPPGTGVVDVTVTSAGGTSATGPQDRYSFAPVVASITPAFGPGAGGTRVLITGDNLCKATGADFGSVPAAAFHVGSGFPKGVCNVVATSPPGTGVVDVTVTSAGGTSATGPQDRYSFAPVVASITPAFGPGAGGTRVLITGDNLCKATGADFGSVPAAAFHVGSGFPKGVCNVVATSPPGTGVVDVTVTSAGGTSATGPQDRYSFAPVVASITPAFGPAAGGTHVLITGDNLCKATGADFGSVPAAAFHVGSGFPKGVCNVVATSPPGTGVVDVTVTSAGGTSATGPQDRYSYK